MDDRDINEIRRLAGEGKQISKIWEENYSQYDYFDVYFAAYEGGERSALGVKRMITTRLNKIAESRKASERKEMIDEIDELVWHLYESLKYNQQKLDKIRKAINDE